MTQIHTTTEIIDVLEEYDTICQKIRINSCKDYKFVLLTQYMVSINNKANLVPIFVNIAHIVKISDIYKSNSPNTKNT